MRIIAGKFRGRKLVEFDVDSTRPTLDRIKEPLFSILMPYLEGAKVLDLFSGTGNLALEALSRGASFAWMNDINKRALRVISSNVSLTHTENCVKITGKDYAKCLKQIHEEGLKFDIIFLDPPYKLNLINCCLDKIHKYNLLNVDGIIVCEYENESIDCFDSNGYGSCLRQTKRGKTEE